MHNVNVEAVERTAARAAAEPSSVVQRVAFAGDWQASEGAPQFRAENPVPNGRLRSRLPAADGRDGIRAQSARVLLLGRAGGYGMTFAQEAARRGVELRALHARVEADVDQSRALGVSDRPPVERIDWHLEVDADAAAEVLEALRRFADDHCPGAFCIRNPIDLHTHVAGGH